MRIVRASAEQSRSGDLILDASGEFVRSASATVNFTSAEASIVIRLVDAGSLGLCVQDIAELLRHPSSDKSIHTARTHISKIRQKLALIGEERISIGLDRDRQRYFIVTSEDDVTSQAGIPGGSHR